MDFGAITTRPCENIPAPLDPRCADPAFSVANPGICPPSPTLIIKPGVALSCVLGSIQFKAFTVFGAIETDVTAQAVFTTSDLNIVAISASSGNATAIQAGIATISASYNGMQAHAELTVLAGENCCDGTEVALTVLVDNSFSMSQVFNASYATKLAYAKAAAAQFIGEINGLKDSIGLEVFNSDTVQVLSLPQHDETAVATLVSSIIQTQSDTAFFNGLQQAVDDLNGATGDLKVLVLISDGLATTTEPDSPYTLLTDFKNQGGVVICLGVRAGVAGFAALEALATPGFFVNAYDATAADALDFVSGLKGYFCTGNCTPAGDVMVNQGELDYDGFINWDVVNSDSTVLNGAVTYSSLQSHFTFISTNPHGFTTGDVITIRAFAGGVSFFNGTYTITVTATTQFTCPIAPLVGNRHSAAWARKDPNPGSVDLLGNGFFDFLPGNGLYVDLISGLNANPPFNGQLVSKVPFLVGLTQTVYLLNVNLEVDRTAGPTTLPVTAVTVDYANNPMNHGLKVGQLVTVSDASNSFFNGTFTVVTVPDPTTFTYSITNPGGSGIVDDSGLLTPLSHLPTYSLTVRLAGNQLVDRPADTVAVQVYWLNGFDKVYLINQQVTISDFKQGFTDYSFTFATPDTNYVFIAIQQLDIPTVDSIAGVLLGEVKLLDVSNLITMLDDDFDDENPQYVPPRCGFGTTYLSYGYAYGYNCYGTGCLDTPPPAQLPDPNQQADIESGATPGPITYSATKTLTATCAGGSVTLSNLVGCTEYLPTDDCPTVNVVSSGFGDGSFNFQYTLWAAQAPVAYQVTRKPGSVTGPPAAWTFDGSNDGTTWTNLDSQSGQVFASGETKIYYAVTTTPYLYYRLNATSGVPAETLFQIYLTGPQQASGTGSATSTISQADADAKATAAALADAQSKLNCQVYFTSTKSFTASCGPGIGGSPGEATASATRTSVVSQADADSKALVAAQAAAEAMLVCSEENNTDPITITDRPPGSLTPQKATPYPSTAKVTGGSGLITNVTVNLNNFSHTWPSDVCIVLKGPDGTTCVLMAGCGDGGFAVSNIQIEFDDSGGPMPQFGALASLTYAPTTYPPFADVPAPGPVSPYGTSLSVFNGKDPNGFWTLWVCDEAENNDGLIANGWVIVIVAA